MRIIIPNLHANWMLLKTSSVFVFKNSAATKHAYLLKYMLQNEDIEVCNYINDRGFSLYTKGSGLLQKFLNLFSVLENNIILKKNGINPHKITIIRNLTEIKSDDIILLYNILPNGFRGMENVNAFKVLSMIHFHGRAYEEALIKKAGVNCFMGEVNLSKTSKIFQEYYHFNLPWITHPFVFEDRFINSKPYSQRKNKCFSTGTITYKKHREFLNIYGDSCNQPIRKLIKDNQLFFNDTIDCFNSDYLEDNPGKTIGVKDNIFVKFHKRIYNRTHIGRQTKYFSFNMVEKFNSYKMHIVGEEILGVPGIGYVEGMACGSAYIGIESSMYKDLGLNPGDHYISYDGTKEGLKTTIEFYQKEENQLELSKIAKRGYEFVKNNFCGKKVAEKLIQDIIKNYKQWQLNQ